MKTQCHHTAGGVVFDGRGRLLALERHVPRDGAVVHEIRLPKGHLDPGETPEQAAVREVREESGYQGLEITADLGEAESEYTFRGKRHHRTERCFLMRLTDPRRGAPQPVGEEEALFSPLWLDPQEAAERLTYPSEQEFARRALLKMAERERQRAD